MRLWSKLAVGVAVLAASAAAQAHEFSCARELGLVQVDEAGQVVVGSDGLPVFAAAPAPVLEVDSFPATLGIRIGLQNLAGEPSVVTGWFDSLQNVPDLRPAWYGAPLAPGFTLPVGGAAAAVAVVSLPDRLACLALTGIISVERLGGRVCAAGEVDGRFDVYHDAGMAECRSRLVCGGTDTLRIQKTGAGSGTITSDPPGIQCGDTCEASFPFGTTVSLTATPDPGSWLGSWGGACPGYPPCTVAPWVTGTVVARFDPLPTAYALQELQLPGGAFTLQDLNERGQVLGTYTTVSGLDPRPFVWEPDTGAVRFLDGGQAAVPWRYGVALNDVGTVLLRDDAGRAWLVEGDQARALPSDDALMPEDVGNQGWVVGNVMGGDHAAFLHDGSVLHRLGEGEAVAVNGAGVVVGTGTEGAARFTLDQGAVLLMPGPGSRAVAVTEGGLVYGTGREGGVPATTFGFIFELATGGLTRIEPEPLAVEMRVVDGNDRREALVTDETVGPALWSAGVTTPLVELAPIPWDRVDAVAINGRGQILVSRPGGGGGILNPR